MSKAPSQHGSVSKLRQMFFLEMFQPFATKATKDRIAKKLVAFLFCFVFHWNKPKRRAKGELGSSCVEAEMNANSLLSCVDLTRALAGKAPIDLGVLKEVETGS